jgi:alkaline phosphatase D
MLGAAQKEWFFARLRAATAPWKLWGNSVGILDWRIDFQNLPVDLGPQWPTTGYALLGGDDWSAYPYERKEILDLVRREGIAGLVSIAGDRHAFSAGLVSSDGETLPNDSVIAEFITGSVSAPGLFEAAEYALPSKHPLRAIYLYEPGGGKPVQPAINLSMMHGVQSSLALQRTGDLSQALAASNPDLAPQLAFADVGGHGYAMVRATTDALEVEFVCIPRPLERSDRPDGGPLAYRVTHRVRHWAPGETPRVDRVSAEGELPLGVQR